MTSLAIVVPTLDEEEALREHLAAALPHGDELVVSDGDSGDRTREVARELGVPVVVGAPGRGGQLNRGARATTAEVILFLHADTRLPADAREGVLAAVAGGAVGGAFRVRFDRGGFWMRLGGRLVNLRTRLTGLPLGDQAQFVTRRAFRELGGFREWPILEDLDLARRLKAHGRLEILESPVTTAARRYLAGGIFRTVARNWLIWSLFALGVHPRRLARLYRKIR